MFDGEHGTIKALSPRKRGAAGIRGLGAPGTAPSKQLGKLVLSKIQLLPVKPLLLQV